MSAAVDWAADWDATRQRFLLPDGLVYLDGNSLGPLTKAAEARLARVARDEWGHALIRGWNQHGWMDLPRKVGDKIGKLVGAAPGTVIAADTTSANLYKLLAGALQLCPDRRLILSDKGNFPTDLYMVQGLSELLGRGHELLLVEPEHVLGAIDERVAVLMLTEVDYRTGRLHDMGRLTARAHEAGALALWDLAHSAGALPVDLAGSGADLAVGCGYKYLNGGPGAPAWLYVRPGLQDQMRSPLSGWMGHASPFAFDLDYRPAEGIQRQACGTPSILGLSALDAALDAFDGVKLPAIRARSQALTSRFIALVDRFADDHGLVLATPRDPDRRGSQVSWHCPEGYAVMQALIAHNIIGDFRAPDLIRFGVAPLYNGDADIERAAGTLERVLAETLWDRPEHRARAKVT